MAIGESDDDQCRRRQVRVTRYWNVVHQANLNIIAPKDLEYCLESWHVVLLRANEDPMDWLTV